MAGTEKTPEQINAELTAQVAELTAKNAELETQVTDLTAKNTELTGSIEEAVKNASDQSAAKIAELEAKIAELESANEEFTKSVPGTYTSKEHGVTVKFKDGYLKTYIGSEKVPSKEVIANKKGKYTEELDRLIEIGYAGLEEVSKK